MLRGSVTVSGEGHFWSKILMSEKVFSGGLFASNVTQVAVISGCNGSYVSMRPRGHVRHLAFGDRGHAKVKCTMSPKTVAGGVPFWREVPMSEGGWSARSWSPISLKGLQFLV